jgi:class 3 adenylate cyclase
VVATSGTRFAQSGELSIAYQVIGDGPVDTVFIPGFVSHQDFLEESDLYRGICERLSAFSRVITFDKRGTGASDRSLGFGSAEERMDDIRAVMDATASERAALVGLSEGGPLTLLFAASYPERATALVAWDTFARLLAAPDYEIGADPVVVKQFNQLVSDLWGTGQALRLFAANMPEDDPTNKLLARVERAASTPGGVRDILDHNAEMDVRAALPAISAPTLVVHRSGDPLLPPAHGRYLAESIAGARYVELPGDFHSNGAPHGEDDCLDVIEEFLTGHRPTRPVEVDRVLATVLFTDIAGSTERASELGDRKWRELLDDFRARVRRELEHHRGREVNTRGDDFLALFDGPGRAVRCAHAVADAVRPLGIDVRSGLHTGEVELQGDDVAGMAVHIGARVSALAGPGEVLVTSTVKDLVVGSDLAFTSKGQYSLKGVPGEWAVHAAVS